MLTTSQFIEFIFELLYKSCNIIKRLFLQVGMMNPAQDGLAPPGGAPSYQQPLYLQEPHTPVTSHG